MEGSGANLPQRENRATDGGTPAAPEAPRPETPAKPLDILNQAAIDARQPIPPTDAVRTNDAIGQQPGSTVSDTVYTKAPTDGTTGKAALEYTQQSTTATTMKDVTMRMSDGTIQTARERFDPATKQTTVAMQRPDGQTQLYQRDDRTNTLQRIDASGKPVAGDTLKYENIRSGHPIPGSEGRFIAQPTTQPVVRDMPARTTVAERPPTTTLPTRTERTERVVGDKSYTVLPERRETTFRPGGDKPIGGERPGGDRPGGPGPGRHFGSDAVPGGGRHGTFTPKDPSVIDRPGMDRTGRLQTDLGRTEAAQRHLDAANKIWGSDHSRGADAAIAHRRADIQDQIGRTMGGGGRTFNPPENFKPPQVVREGEIGRHGGRNWPGHREGGGGGSDGRPDGGHQPWGGRRQLPPGGEGVGGGGPRKDGEPGRPGGPRGEFSPTGVRPQDARMEARLAEMQGQQRGAMLDAINKFQQGKLPLTPDGMALGQIFKGMRPDQLIDLKATLAGQDRRAGLPLDIGKLRPETQKAMGDMLTILNKTGRFDGTTDAGRLTSMRVLDLLGRPDRQFDKVPTADQSRTIMLELAKGFGDRRSLDGRAQDRAGDLVTRSLGDKPGERGFLPGDKTQFTLRMDNMDPTVRDLVVRLQNRDFLGAQQRDVRQETITARAQEARIEPSTITSRVAPEAIQNVRAEDTARTLTTRESGTTAAEGTLFGKVQQGDVLPGQTQQAKLDPLQTNAAEIAIAQANAQKQQDQINLQLEEEKRKRKEKEEEQKEKEERKQLSQEELMALMQARKLKELKDRELKQKEKSQEQDKKQQLQQRNQRTRYRIRQGDTLSNIAAKHLQDSKLAQLIYQINNTVIPTMTHQGKRYADPQVGSLIWLPSQTDVESFRSKKDKEKNDIDFTGPQFGSAEDELKARFGDNWQDNPAAAAFQAMQPKAKTLAELEKAKSRRENVEKYLGPLADKKPENDDDRIRHICRLGDTLRSIALKHPALLDSELWELIASVNNLSSETDEDGNPQAKLSRGMVLILPSPEEINAFRASKPGQNAERVELADSDDEAKVSPQATADEKESATDIVENINEKARIITTGNAYDPSKGLTITLEVLAKGAWTKALTYDFFEETGLRHQYDASGKKQTMRITLPPNQAIQLAQNELKNRWEQHYTRLAD
ncbi:MAG: LysM peptidoglycan-binding domain-containing protein [Candidatus Obscuribacterales bacterium]|nr:LysM peptidoglycan-binding domain-containing protein [Candidatus Obscuribacterales bacterium]